MTPIEIGFPHQPGLLMQRGPTVPVRVGVGCDAADGADASEHFALIDTGAQNNWIDDEFARAIGLMPFGYLQVSGVGGYFETETFTAHAYIPVLDYTVTGRFIGANLLSAGQPHAVILGREFLASFTMTYDGGTGTVTLERPAPS
ncbi:MAG: retropepsin-like aspartic protease [Chloroflexota bacterium]|nr:retropepsin-like aspartic protease [Chloroflexota bacterium]